MPNLLYEKNNTQGHNPKIILENAKTWKILFEQNIEENNLYMKNTSILCLLFSLELHLKAYLVFLDNSYSNDKKLKCLEHNFYKIYNALEPLLKITIKKELLDILNFCNLYRDFDFAEFRYPRLGSTTTYPALIYEEGENIFSSMFNYIEEEILKINL